MAQQTFSGVPGTFSAGEILTASDQEKLRDFILYLIKDGDETDTGETSPLILDLGSDVVDIVDVDDTMLERATVEGLTDYAEVEPRDCEGCEGCAEVDDFAAAGGEKWVLSVRFR